MIETLKKFIVDANFIQGIHKQKPLYREIQVQIKPVITDGYDIIIAFSDDYKPLFYNPKPNVFMITTEGLERYFELLGIDKSKYGSIKIVPKIR